MFSGTETVSSWALVLSTLSSNNQYKVWLLDFITLKENNDDFKDNNWKDYIYAYAAKWKDLLFQVAGKVKNSDGSESAIVAWTFYHNPNTTTDVEGLIKWSDGTNSGAVVNKWLFLPY
jgi:hypothetical protein